MLVDISEIISDETGTESYSVVACLRCIQEIRYPWHQSVHARGKGNAYAV